MSDPLRQALVRAARQRLGASIAALVGGILLRAGGSMSTVRVELIFDACWIAAPLWLVTWGVISLRRLQRPSGPLDESLAYQAWGRAALGDAVGIVPWAMWSLVGFFTTLDADEPEFYGLVACGSGAVAFAVIHLLALPNALHRARIAASAHMEPPDPVRGGFVPLAFRHLASLRLLALVIALCSFVLPWIHDGPHESFHKQSRPCVQSDGTTRTASLVGVLAGVMGRPGSEMAWFGAGGVLLLAALAAWELRRSRWPSRPPWSQTRVFAAWGMTLLASVLPMFAWLMLMRLPHSVGVSMLIGGWISAAAFLANALLLLAFTPICLARALWRQAEAERMAALAERSEGVPRDPGSGGGETR